MTIWLPEKIGKCFMLFFAGGVIGFLPQVKRLFSIRKSSFVRREKICDTQMEIKYTYVLERWRKEGVLYIGLLVTLILPNILNMYNSYVNDYQPQGRYSMPMIIPLMCFMTMGYKWILERLKVNNIIKNLFCYGVCAGMVLLLLYSYFCFVLPNCR